jgi:hypothetical protein
MRRRRQEWIELIRECERSGARVESFAAKRKIRAEALKWWIGKLRREEANGPTLLPVRVVGLAAPSARRSGDGGGRIEAELPDGLKLRFAAEVGLEAVVEVVGRLRRC